MLNLTNMRKRALRIIHQRPEMTAQDLAYELVEGTSMNPAAATRWGAGYAKPLIVAGLVAANSWGISCGWAKLTLTEAGRAAALAQN